MTENETKADFDFLYNAVREASDLALSYFSKQGSFNVWNKDEGSPVSEADHAVDALLNERLRQARPDYGWLSEETEDTEERLTTARQWLVDPIDGTRAFIKGVPHFTVCGALVEDGKPRMAVVANPATQEFFTAISGAGAQLNGDPIRVSQTAQLEGARMLGPKAMYGHVAWKEPWPDMTIDNPNSIAYRLCLVAAGMRDGCVRLNGCHEWDVAAAHLIVEEAGGVVTTHNLQSLTYNKPKPTITSVIAGGPEMHRLITDRTKDIKLPG